MRIQQVKKQQKKRNMVVQKSFRQIQISQRVFYQNTKTYKGNRKDTNLLNINFKTIICRILEDMCHMKEVTQEEFSAIQKYKESPASFQSLITLIYRKVDHRLRAEKDNLEKQKIQGKFMQQERSHLGQQIGNMYELRCPNVLRRLRELFQSSEIMRRVFGTEGTILNKLLMLKYLEAIRYTVIGNGEIIKWKEIKSVTVLKEEKTPLGK